MPAVGTWFFCLFLFLFPFLFSLFFPPSLLPFPSQFRDRRRNLGLEACWANTGHCRNPGPALGFSAAPALVHPSGTGRSRELSSRRHSGSGTECRGYQVPGSNRDWGRVCVAHGESIEGLGGYSPRCRRRIALGKCVLCTQEISEEDSRHAMDTGPAQGLLCVG